MRLIVRKGLGSWESPFGGRAPRESSGHLPVRRWSLFMSFRNNPEIQSPAIHLDRFIRFPVAHIEAVGDDAGPGLQLRKQPGFELLVDAWKQVQSDNSGWLDFGGEKVALYEPDLVLDAGFLSVLVRFFDALGIYIHAGGCSPELFRRHDDNAAIAAAEIVHHIALMNIGELEHLFDHFGRGWNEWDVGIMLRSSLRKSARGEHRRG